MNALCLLLAALGGASAFVATPLRPTLPSAASSSPLAVAAPAHALRQPLVASRSSGAQMGLFGLGTPELAIIAGVALLVLGPDQVKKMAKDVGKISAELKQVPEEFNKGIEVGTAELEAKKAAPAAPAAEKPPAEGDTPA